MVKDDYMKLDKERLAELLEERDERENLRKHSQYMPSNSFLCDGRICTNPCFDCINCPRRGGNYLATINTNNINGNNKIVHGLKSKS